MNAERVRHLEAAHLAPLYRRAPIVFARGVGARLYDTEGRAYLDFLSGIGVAALGHGHPRLAAALAAQAQTLLHTSNLYVHEGQGELARRLAALSGLPRVFFCNSGTEAIEAALKFARRYWHARGERRPTFVALEHGFHGRTFGSLSVTWEPSYRAPFAPLVPEVRFVPPDDPAALTEEVTTETAAIVFEPIQGEGGVRPLSRAFADALAAARTRTGALLVADEVQSGLGRTGELFYSTALGIRPDLLAVGKALGAGMPVAATLMSEAVAQALRPGDHGSTYGGNPLACRAALVFLEELTERGLLDHVRRVGPYLGSRLRDLAAAHPSVIEVRGAGLIWGLALAGDAAPVVDAALARGLLVNRTAGTVVRLLPPFIVSEADIDEAVRVLDGVLRDVAVGVPS
jgi:acetylornithine/N-succinyldiaminopimelate aminotransferase